MRAHFLVQYQTLAVFPPFSLSSLSLPILSAMGGRGKGCSGHARTCSGGSPVLHGIWQYTCASSPAPGAAFPWGAWILCTCLPTLTGLPLAVQTHPMSGPTPRVRPFLCCASSGPNPDDADGPMSLQTSFLAFPLLAHEVAQSLAQIQMILALHVGLTAPLSPTPPLTGRPPLYVPTLSLDCPEHGAGILSINVHGGVACSSMAP